MAWTMDCTTGKVATRLLACVCLGFVLVLACVVADDAAINELRELAAGSRDGVLRLKDDTYKDFAKSPDKPRRYFLVVFYDALMLRDNLQLNLAAMRKDFVLLAKAYAASDAASKEPPVFFADVEFKESEWVFKSEGINSLPLIKIFPPGSEPKGVSLDINRHGRSFASLVKFLKDSGIDTSGVKPPPPLTKFQMVVAAIFFVITAPMLATYLVTHKTVLHDPRMWCLAGLIIYLFSVSGFMFNIIRNMPWYIPDREKPGRFVYFLQQSGNQFGVEGLVIGSFYTAVGLLTAFNVYVLPRAKSDVLKRVVGMISIALCAFAVRKVVDFEVWKQGYWVHGFWPNSWR